MTLPNFLIIGAAKSGTTSLYYYLGQHPQIFTNVKEPSYFAFAGQEISFAGPGDEDGFVRRVVTNFEQYKALFAGVTTEVAYGESSVIYLYHPQAAARIYHTIPDVKLIAILRNPVERAFSSYLHLRRDGREPLADFGAALAAEDDRIQANWEHQWHYTRLGYYYTQLKRYYDLFPAENIAVYTYDEFKGQPRKVLHEIFEFLEVDPKFKPDTSVKHNVSGTPRLKGLHSFLIRPNILKDLVRPLLPRSLRRTIGTSVKAWNVTAEKPQMPDGARDYLAELFHTEIMQLQALIQRDLSHWLQPEPQLARNDPVRNIQNESDR